MITAIILSSFFVKKRYYIESTNFLHILSIMFPVQSLIWLNFCFHFQYCKSLFVPSNCYFNWKITHLVYIWCPFRIFKAVIFNYLYTIKIRKLFSNTKTVNRHILLLQYTFSKDKYILEFLQSQYTVYCTCNIYVSINIFNYYSSTGTL